MNLSKIIFSMALALSTLSASAQTATWTNLPVSGGPPTARYGFSAVMNTSNGRVIMFGGIFGTSGTPPLGNDVWVLSDVRTNGGNTWQQRTVTGSAPSARGYSNLAYDQVNNRLIVFGGDPNVGNCNVDVNDVWVMTNADGTTGTSGWVQLSPTGTAPGKRSSAGIVYDSANNRLIINGGNVQCGTIYNDVWVLTNANGLGGTPGWTQLSPSGGPGPRSGHFTGYDPGNNRMVFFAGGTSTGTSNDVWVLSNANGLGGTPTWTQLAPTGSLPPPRGNCAAGYDPVLNTLTVFGGSGPTAISNIVWVLSNANGLGGTPSWSQLTVSGPAPIQRYQLGGVVVPGAGRFVIIDGVDPVASIHNDVWAIQYSVPGSMGLWHLNEGAGTNTVDSTGSHPGTLINAPTWTTGVSSNALSFDGGQSSQYVRVNNGPILGTNANLTIEAWIKPGGNNDTAIYCEGNTSDFTIRLGMAIDIDFSPSYAPFFSINGQFGTYGASNSVVGPISYSVGHWHHIAAVLQSGVGGVLYIDGQPVKTNVTMTVPVAGATETDIGRNPKGNGYFNGVIDEVQVFNTARTAAQILADYQQYTPPALVADVQVTQVLSPNPVGLNSNVFSFVTVRNLGPDVADNIVITNFVPPQLAVTFALGWVWNGAFLTTNIVNLASNGAVSLQFTARANSPTPATTNICVISSSSIDPVDTNNIVVTPITIIAPPPVITNQPISQTVSSGGTFFLTVGASGYSTLTYQWLHDGTNITGANGSTLTVNGSLLSDAGSYSVVVSNAEGVVTSSVALVSLFDLQLYAGITISGPVGTNYEVDYRTNMNDPDWTVLTNFALPEDPYLFIDVVPANTHRFYRVIEP